MIQNELSNEAQALSTLINYQEGSIVSRMLLKKTAGNVTLFAFAAGQGLSEHTTPHDALVLAVEGQLEITIADHSHQLAAGEVLLLPADIPHAVQAAGPGKMLLIMIRQ